MHDLSYFRTNFDRIAERLAARSNPPNLERFRELDRERRAAISQTEQLKARRNAETQEIARLKRRRAPTRPNAQKEMRAIGDEVGASRRSRSKRSTSSFGELLAGHPERPARVRPGRQGSAER